MVTTLRPAVNKKTVSSLDDTPSPGSPSAPVHAPFTGRNTSDIGSLTHLLVGFYAQQVRTNATSTTTGPDPANASAVDAADSVAEEVSRSMPSVGGNLLNRMFAAAYDLVEATPNARRVLATEAAALTYRYFIDFLPDPSWHLLGVEYDTGDGKVDLAWVHHRTGAVFYDEVKTSRVAHGRVLPASWVRQARRYSTAGSDRYGERFLGTRLIPLTAEHLGLLVLNGGALLPLATTGCRTVLEQVSKTDVKAGQHPVAHPTAHRVAHPVTASRGMHVVPGLVEGGA